MALKILRKRKSLIASVVGALVICVLLFLIEFQEKSEMKSFNFILPEITPPNSLDPLESDYSINLHASQMVHTTLLEVSGDNTLSSSVLKNFSYDPKLAEIRFDVRLDFRFSDGSQLTAKDVEMTVKRMIARRPTFPVIRHIRGVKEWAAQKSPLKQTLTGVTVEGNSVFIKLDRDVRNPLFRFALPLFGIVKHECIDLTTNEVRDNCPSSGRYSVEYRENVLVFKANGVNQKKGELPGRIEIEYLGRPLQREDLKRLVDGTNVILVQEYNMDSAEADEQKRMGFERIEQPNSRFSAFILNPRNEAFRTKQCRQVFADSVRSYIASSSSLIQKESSIFSRILPGFQTQEDLKFSSPQPMDQIQKCKAELRGKKIRWISGNNNNSKLFQAALTLATQALEMDLEILPDNNPKGIFDDFVNGRFDILLGGSGFWAFDPVGDLQMLFTAGLHKPLGFVTSDTKLQNLLEGLEFEDDPTARLKQINQYIYDCAVLNVYTHSKRVYLVNGPSVSRTIPVAITPPAPWQLFNVGRTLFG